jgi:hypothetical protein
MVRIECDGCGRELKKGALRYRVKIDVRAAYDKLELTLLDLVRDHREELSNLVEQMKDKDPARLEEQIYKGYSYDLCPPCHAAYIRDPLRFHPERGLPESDWDVDAFLRSLGYGEEDASQE